MAQFDPFNDRTARDLRNRLSAGMVEALRRGDDAPFAAAAAWAENLAATPAHREYLAGRKEMYARLKHELDPDAGIWETTCALWNHGGFFEVHEVMEDAWRRAAGPEKELLQAMVRAAGVMVHRDAGRKEAAARMAGCGSGGVAMMISFTPATRAGTTVIRTVERSGAPPPGTYTPTRSRGRTSWPVNPSGPALTKPPRGSWRWKSRMRVRAASRASRRSLARPS